MNRRRGGPQRKGSILYRCCQVMDPERTPKKTPPLHSNSSPLPSNTNTSSQPDSLLYIFIHGYPKFYENIVQYFPPNWIIGTSPKSLFADRLSQATAVAASETPWLVPRELGFDSLLEASPCFHFGCIRSGDHTLGSWEAGNCGMLGFWMLPAYVLSDPWYVVTWT
jgi:hypothetical protein